MASEIREQATCLRAESDRYLGTLREVLAGREFAMALLVARGSSDNAALYLRYLLEIHLQIPVSLAAPSVLTRYGSKVRYPTCLAVGISQSGEGPDVSELLSAMRGSGHTTVAITNTPGSRVTKAAEHSLLLEVGAEHAVAATKTYTASLLAAYQLVRALGAVLPDPRDVIPDEHWIDRCEQEAQEALIRVLRAGIVFALGRGYGFCTAHETALKLMECALLPCKSYSVADFEHGPKALAGPASAAIVYGEVPESLRTAEGVVVGAPSRGKHPAAPIAEIVFGQWLAQKASLARGLDPDAPPHLEKVTRTY